MRNIAVSISVVSFFLLALVGWCSGLPVFVCSMRALAGAAVLYVIVKVAGRLILAVMVDAVIKSRSSDQAREGKS